MLPDEIMLKGGISVLLENFRTMAKPPALKFSYDNMINAVCQRSKYIDLPTIVQPCENWLDNLKINVNAYSGFFSALFFGNSRGDAAEASILVAKSLFKRVLKGRTHAMEIWRFGNRPKVVGLDENDKVLRSRPIAMCDDVLSRVCSVVSQPLMTALVRSPFSEIFCGRALDLDTAQYIKSVMLDSDSLCISPD